MQAFVLLSNVGMMVNAAVNANNQLIKVHATRDLFGVLVIASVNMIIM